MSATHPVATPVRRSVAWLTGVVSAGTLAASLAALARATLMQATTRNLAQLRAGQWWRIITPVFVQPDGWGQLAFNLLGVTVIGAALERRMSRAGWTLTYLLGGVVGIVAISAWHPTDRGGGSSDAVAALVGALSVLLAAKNHHPDDHHDPHGRRPWADWPAQVYCVFFASYLTGLDLGGVWWSILAGNATIVAFFHARRALTPSGLTRACLLLVGASGVTMTAQQDGHGLGIIAGAGVASLVLLRRHVLAARSTRSHLPTSRIR
ncbi:MAG: rhomboid family intramembrane serine protease [Actinomycetota bacterium]|nr:rhomboid family intramembrane serine protease [Actinomycetota bacterium]